MSNVSFYPINKKENGTVSLLQTELELERLLKESKGIVVLDIYADWCAPCRFIAPKFTDMAKSFTNMVFAKINIDNLGKFALEYKITALPAFLFFRDGQLIDKFNGANVTELTQKLSSYNFL